MKIRKLHVKNFRLLRDFELDFVDSETGQPRNWTVLVGENGRGKSSILQAIALASVGRTLANSLASGQIASFEDRRLAKQPKAVQIDAEFALPRLGGELGLKPKPERMHPGLIKGAPRVISSSLRLEPRATTLVGQSWYGSLSERPPPSLDDPLESIRSMAHPWWFVGGYGTDRRLRLDSDRPDRPEEQRLRSLFWPDAPNGLGFADRQTYPQSFALHFARTLNEVLQAKDGLTPMVERLELRGPGGASTRDIADKDRVLVKVPGLEGLKLPATYLSHGYQATLAWIADLVGHYLLDFHRSGATKLKNLDRFAFTGLVLIDELDLFLHPRWQIGFIDALSATFPNLQFVATTHSPLLVSKLRPDQVTIVDWNAEGHITPQEFDGDPRLMTATDLYRAIFGIDDTPPEDTLVERVFEYETLARDASRSEPEERRMRELYAELAALRIKGLIEPRKRVP